MKIDLTHMSPPEILRVVSNYMQTRHRCGRPGQSQTVYASDLAAKFKHTGLRTHRERIEFYSNVLKSVVQRSQDRAAMAK